MGHGLRRLWQSDASEAAAQSLTATSHLTATTIAHTTTIAAATALASAAAHPEMRGLVRGPYRPMGLEVYLG